MRLVRFLLPVVAALAACVALAACGGSSGSGSSSPQDVGTLLQQAFSDAKGMKSAKLDARLDLDLTGVANLQAPMSFVVHGPFQASPGGGLPRFDMSLQAKTGGQTLSAGMISTGKAGYLTLLGSAYTLDPQTYAAFRKGFAQGTGERSAKTSATALGFDPRKWLVAPKLAGDAQLDGTDVRHVTAGVDVPKLLGNVEGGLSKTSGADAANQLLPQPLSAAERKKLEQSVRSASVELYIGKDDQRIRRVAVVVRLGGTAEGPNGQVRLDLRFSELDKPQTIEAPADPKPYSQFVSTLQSLIAGTAGSAASGASSGGAGGAASGASGTATSYLDCMDQAKTQDARDACLQQLGGG